MICRLFSPHRGGVERHVEEISRLAVNDGHEVVVITSQYEPQLSYRSRLLTSPDSLVQIKRISTLFENRKQSFHLKIRDRVHIWLWMLINVWLFFTADIVHIHDVFWWYWPIRVLFPWKKLYITYHGFEAGSLPSKKAVRARLLAALCSRGNICVGSWIQKWYGTKPTYITYGGASCAQTMEKKKHIGIRALFVGRLEEDTGLVAYIEAVKNIKNVTVDIAGGGKLLSQVQAAARKNSRITYLGVSNNTCSLYGAYDVIFASSYLSMIEALQCDVPVIAYAQDLLKQDYLNSFPVATEIAIVSTIEQIQTELEKISTKEITQRTKKACLWARQQTWKKVYLVYKKLWLT